MYLFIFYYLCTFNYCNLIFFSKDINKKHFYFEIIMDANQQKS